jgi:hypothetical protein
VDALMAILAELQSADTFADKVYDIMHGTNAGDPRRPSIVDSSH